MICKHIEQKILASRPSVSVASASKQILVDAESTYIGMFMNRDNIIKAEKEALNVFPGTLLLVLSLSAEVPLSVSSLSDDGFAAFLVWAELLMTTIGDIVGAVAGEGLTPNRRSPRTAACIQGYMRPYLTWILDR